MWVTRRVNGKREERKKSVAHSRLTDAGIGWRDICHLKWKIQIQGQTSTFFDVQWSFWTWFYLFLGVARGASCHQFKHPNKQLSTVLNNHVVLHVLNVVGDMLMWRLNRILFYLIWRSKLHCTCSLVARKIMRLMKNKLNEGSKKPETGVLWPAAHGKTFWGQSEAGAGLEVGFRRSRGWRHHSRWTHWGRLGSSHVGSSRDMPPDLWVSHWRWRKIWSDHGWWRWNWKACKRKNDEGIQRSHVASGSNQWGFQRTYFWWWRWWMDFGCKTLWRQSAWMQSTLLQSLLGEMFCKNQCLLKMWTGCQIGLDSSEGRMQNCQLHDEMPPRRWRTPTPRGAFVQVQQAQSEQTW